MHAIVKGTVVFDVGSGCLLLELEDTRYPVVWPAGAEWQVDPPGVVLHGQLIESGMSVHGGGGYLYDTGIEYRAGREVADAAAQCLGPTGEVAFFNSGDTVTVDTN